MSRAVSPLPSERPGPPPLLLNSGVFFIIGLLLVMVVLAVSVLQSPFVAAAQRTQGTVIEINASRHPNSSRRYEPVIQFVAQDGQTYRFQVDMPPLVRVHQVGQQVEVMYDPANPKDTASLAFDNSVLRYPLYLVPFALGLLMLCGGAYGLMVYALRPR